MGILPNVYYRKSSPKWQYASKHVSDSKSTLQFKIWVQFLQAQKHKATKSHQKSSFISILFSAITSSRYLERVKNRASTQQYFPSMLSQHPGLHGTRNREQINIFELSSYLPWIWPVTFWTHKKCWAFAILHKKAFHTSVIYCVKMPLFQPSASRFHPLLPSFASRRDSELLLPTPLSPSHSCFTDLYNKCCHTRLCF